MSVIGSTSSSSCFLALSINSLSKTLFFKTDSVFVARFTCAVTAPAEMRIFLIFPFLHQPKTANESLLMASASLCPTFLKYQNKSSSSTYLAPLPVSTATTVKAKIRISTHKHILRIYKRSNLILRLTSLIVSSYLCQT